MSDTTLKAQMVRPSVWPRVSAPRLIFVALFLTVALFVPLYLVSFWARGRGAVACALLACGVGFLWAP